MGGRRRALTAEEREAREERRSQLAAPTRFDYIRYRELAQDALIRNPGITALNPESLQGSICYGEGTNRKELPPLNPQRCPHFLVVPDEDEGLYPRFGTRIQVVNADTYETAIALSEGLARSEPHVAVLNLANEFTRGGGWLNGARAQEEMLFYRSDFFATLDLSDYPISGVSGCYSPHVTIYKSSDETGYEMLQPPLPMVAGLTVAAIREPGKTRIPTTHPYQPPGEVWTDPAIAQLTMDKIRLALRMAAHHGHTRVVLGAIGCGAFQNPIERVAEQFLHVFMEEEFQGGWFEHVVFAVKNRAEQDGWGVTAFDVFWRILQGVIV